MLSRPLPNYHVTKQSKNKLTIDKNQITVRQKNEVSRILRKNIVKTVGVAGF